jgi:hypothetical protein
VTPTGHQFEARRAVTSFTQTAPAPIVMSLFARFLLRD